MSIPVVGAASSFAAVQARMAQLDALFSGAAPDTADASRAGSSSASSFAAQLAAAGLSDDGSTLLGADGVASAVAAGRSSSTGSGATAQSLIAAAEKYIGTPYVWGGESLSEGGLDCSGLVLRSMTDIGVTGVPRTAHEQMSLGTAVPSLTQAQPGDLLVFYGGKHIGIYLGDGKMIDSPHPGGQVSIRDVFTTPTAIRRVLPQAAPSTTVAGATGTADVASATDATRLAALGMLQGVAS